MPSTILQTSTAIRHSISAIRRAVELGTDLDHVMLRIIAFEMESAAKDIRDEANRREVDFAIKRHGA